MSVGISNGRGGLLGTGTNAPLYTTTFSDGILKAQEDREKHEGRLATALGLDRAQRVFDFISPSLSPQNVSSSKLKQTQIEKKTMWTGTEWVKNGSRPSKQE